MKKLIIIITSILFVSCIKNEVDGIQIGHTLIENRDYSENKKLAHLIEDVLNQNRNSLSDLINFNCGGAAGCYDLGSVITQIIKKVGENNFIVMSQDLHDSEKLELNGFIEVGLEYGYRLNGKKQNKEFKKEFPLLYKYLNNKTTANSG